MVYRCVGSCPGCRLCVLIDIFAFRNFGNGFNTEYLLPLDWCAGCRLGWCRCITLLESNALLNADIATIWEVDSVAIALWVKAYPVAIAYPHVELCAQRVMDLHSAAPDWYVLEVWLFLIQHLIGCFLAELTCRGMVFHPSCVHDSLSPQTLQHATSMHHGAHPFDQCPVQPFSDTVVLRCVVHSHPALSTLQLKVLCEFSAQVLSTTI